MVDLKITFSDDVSKRFILEAFDKGVDEQSYIIENSTGERVLARNGEEITFEEFAAIRKGSEVFVKSDLPSLIQLCDDLAAKKSNSEQPVR